MRECEPDPEKHRFAALVDRVPQGVGADKPLLGVDDTQAALEARMAAIAPPQAPRICSWWSIRSASSLSAAASSISSIRSADRRSRSKIPMPRRDAAAGRASGFELDARARIRHSGPMRIASFNINGIKARLPRLLEWLEETRPTVACLQEIKTQDEGFPAEEFAKIGYHAIWHGQKSFNGVAILSKLPLSDIRRGLPGDDADEQSRWIEAVVDAVLAKPAKAVVAEEADDAAAADTSTLEAA